LQHVSDIEFMRFEFPAAVLCAFAFASVAGAADPTYWQDVRPIFRKHCTVCHSQKNLAEPDVSAGLALDSLEAIRKGAKRPVVVPGKAADSQLAAILRHPKPSRRMPLDAPPLPDGMVALLKQWIDAGLPEGAKPADTIVPASPSAPARRKIDVVIATKCTLPKSVAKPGQTNPLEVVLAAGPLAPVTAVTLSGDGRLLAAGSYGRVAVWDLKEATVAKVLTNVLGAINDLKFSPDGSLLAVSGGQPSARGDIRLFTVADWKHAATLGMHTDVVGSVAFSPNGQFLASASFDKTVRVWNLSTRESVMTFTGHSDFVNAVAFGPKGDWLVTASKDKTSRLIDLKSGQSRLTFSGTDQEVLAVAVKPDGSAVVTAGLDPSLSWWNSQTGERLKRTAGHDVAVHELAFSPTGDFAASAGADKTVRLWNAKSMDSQGTIAVGSMVYSVAVAANGKSVAAGTFDGMVRLFDTKDGRPMATLLAHTDDEWLALTPEGFAATGPAWMKSVRWRVAPGSELNLDWVWKSVGQPARVLAALSGQKPGEPIFSAPQP